MDSRDVIVIILAIIGAAGATLTTGILARPKTTAEAGQIKAGGEVSISADAREWAREFKADAAAAVDRANAAEVRADAAEERATVAEKRAEDCVTRCDDLEARFILLANYTQSLRRELVAAGGHPPAPPAQLIPPLTLTPPTA